MSSDFSEEDYPSERLSLSSPKKVRRASNINSEEDRGITIIRGRNYSLSPHKSPIKPKATLPSRSRSTKRVISFKVNEKLGDGTKRRENVGRSSKSAKVSENGEAELIDCYGFEAENRVKKNERYPLNQYQNG